MRKGSLWMNVSQLTRCWKRSWKTRKTKQLGRQRWRDKTDHWFKKYNEVLHFSIIIHILTFGLINTTVCLIVCRSQILSQFDKWWQNIYWGQARDCLITCWFLKLPCICKDLHMQVLKCKSMEMLEHYVYISEESMNNLKFLNLGFFDSKLIALFLATEVLHVSCLTWRQILTFFLASCLVWKQCWKSCLKIFCRINSWLNISWAFEHHITTFLLATPYNWEYTMEVVHKNVKVVLLWSWDIRTTIYQKAHLYQSTSHVLFVYPLIPLQPCIL